MEFALVIPVLLMLVLGVSDLGRVFATGVMTESAARDAAEIAAQQYLHDYPIAAPAPPPSNYYANLHLRAAQAVCAELKALPNTNFDSTTGNCSGWPIVMACVHDGVDDACGTEPFGDPIPPACNTLATPPTSAQPAGTEQTRFVEVRVCYQFTPLIHGLLLPISDIYLQNTRVFTVADY